MKGTQRKAKVNWASHSPHGQRLKCCHDTCLVSVQQYPNFFLAQHLIGITVLAYLDNRE